MKIQLYFLTLASFVYLAHIPPLPAQVEDLTTAELLVTVAERDEQARRDAVYELVRREATSPNAILTLSKLLNDEDIQVRFQALLGLARAGADAAPVAESLIHCFADRNDQVRYRASVAVGKIGASVVPDLERVWRVDSAEARICASDALAIIGPPAINALPTLLGSLSDQRPTVRLHAARAIAAVAPGDELALRELAEHDDPRVQIVGLSALGKLASPSAQIQELFSSAMSHSEAAIREVAILAITQSGLPPERKTRHLMRAVIDSEASVRNAAVASISKSGLKGGTLAAALASLLPDVEGEPAAAVIRAIAENGASARVALPSLMQAANRGLVDDDILANTLASLGPTIVSDLLQKVQQNPRLEPIVSQACARMGKAAIAEMMEHVDAHDEVVRVVVIRSIGSLRPQERKLQDQLLGALQDRSAQVRVFAVESLLQIAEEVPFARDPLLTATQDKDAAVRSAALASLLSFRYSSAQREQALQRGLADINPRVRRTALKLIADNPEWLPGNITAVLELLADDSPEVRRVSVRCLRELPKKFRGPDQELAVANALRDEDGSVRIEATRTAAEVGLDNPVALDAYRENLGIQEQDDQSLELIETTLLAVAALDEDGNGLVREIRRLLEHERSSVRAAALKTLIEIHPNAAQLGKLLEESLSDAGWEVRQTAAEGLGNLGPEGIHAVRQLFAMLSNDEDSDFAGEALRRIDAVPEDAADWLVEALDSKDRRTSQYAVFLLGKLGPAAETALPRLHKMLRAAEERRPSDSRTRMLRQTISSIEESEDEPDS